MDNAERRAMNRGLGDGLARAFELAAVPAIFGAAGWLIDRWLGTTPLFTMTLALLGFVGKLLAMWYHYAAQMEHLERTAAEQRTAPAPEGRPAFAARPSDEPATTLPAGVTLDGRP
jgi:F0F1-type ATP synthase assembly protein I